MVIDTRGDPAAEFHHVDVLAAHAQVILKGLLRDMTSGNAHRHGAHRQVAPASHEPDCQGGSSEAENPGRDVVSEGVVGILNIMTVDGEGQNTQLCVGRHGRSHGDGSRTFSGVEPPRVRNVRSQDEDFGDAVPRGGDGEIRTDTHSLERTPRRRPSMRSRIPMAEFRERVLTSMSGASVKAWKTFQICDEDEIALLSAR